MSDLRQEHGRLVGRLKRQLGAIERCGVTDERARKVLRTVRKLIVVERRIEDPLWAAKCGDEVTDEELRARVALMTPRAGLAVVGDLTVMGASDCVFHAGTPAVTVNAAGPVCEECDARDREAEMAIRSEGS